MKAFKRLVPMVAVLAAAAALVACGREPDTRLSPEPARMAWAELKHPFAGSTLAVDPFSQSVQWQADHGDPRWLDAITDAPQARWLNTMTDVKNLPEYLRAVRRQNALPVVVAYAIPNRGCAQFREGLPYGDYDRPTARSDSYRAFITELVEVLGSTKAVVVIEPDAVPSDCFDEQRAQTIRGAVTQLAEAGQHVYIDAGHPSWVKSGPTAERLLRSGVTLAEGVSLNVANRYPTESVARFGEELSDLIGGRDYIVDSGRNGAQVPAETIAGDWCNRPDQALGVQATTSLDAARFPHMAAQLWIKPPGESDGNAQVFPNVDCHGETEPPGFFSGTQARALVANDPTQPPAVRRAAQGAVRR